MARSLFLRGLAIVYLIAFISLLLQVNVLIGSNGSETEPESTRAVAAVESVKTSTKQVANRAIVDSIVEYIHCKKVCDNRGEGRAYS